MKTLKSYKQPQSLQAVTNTSSTTQGASTKADRYATPEKYTQVTVDIYSSLEGVA